MKKHLFLSLLVFCFSVIFLTTYIKLINANSINQVLNSKTKDETELNAKSDEFIDTKEITLKSETSNTENNITKSNVLSTESNEKIETKVLANSEITKTFNLDEPTSEFKYAFLKNPENIPIQTIKIAEEEIDKIPKKIIETFYKEHWSISITDQNISLNYFNGAYGNVMGLTITDEKKILIQNRKQSIKNSVVHEIGHYLDWHFDFPSLDKEFNQIYHEEVDIFKSRITNSSCVSNEMEFFAHTFYYLIKDSSKCTPKALKFVQDYIYLF